MAQVFPPGANWLVKWTLFGGAGGALLLTAVAWGLYLSPEVTRLNNARQHEIPFNHQRHVQGNGIDCRYCHTTVETSPFAGLPATETCMSCHSQVFADQPILEPARESWRSGQPMEWTRIYDLPDFVYFNHSIHVNKGVGCSTCHGRVDEMPLTRKVSTLRMSWCLRCHRAPEKYLRPPGEIFNMEWTGSKRQIAEWWQDSQGVVAESEEVGVGGDEGQREGEGELPRPPTNLEADVGPDRVILTWTASRSPKEVASYTVFRGVTALAMAPIGTVSAETRYEDSRFETNAFHFYVYAVQTVFTDDTISELSKAWEPKINQKEMGRVLLKRYHIVDDQLLNCSICHR